MRKIRCKLTVWFDPPFWVGVAQREEEGGGLEVCRVVFGAEPKDAEVYRYFLENWHLLRFYRVCEEAVEAVRPGNPKRMQRLARREQARVGVGTKAQRALAEMREEGKKARKTSRKKQREAEKERKLELRWEKRRQKHRGH